MPSLPDIEFEPNDFVHLHLHTDYSLLQSTVQLKPLSARLTELGLKACAITDYGNIYGAVSFFNAMCGKGIKPIIGIEAFLTLGSRHDKVSTARAGERPYYNILLLAKDLDGYHDLIHLSSKAFTQGMSTRPRIDLELLKEYSSGIIAISCLKTGPIGHFLDAGEMEIARKNASSLIDILGTDRLFLEINDTGQLSGDDLIAKTADFAKEIGIGLVATNDVHYLTREDAQAQEVLVAIGEGRTVLPNRIMSDDDSRKYLRSAEEMWDLFGDKYPEALTNTVKIAEMCTLEIPQGDDVRQLPDFPIPPGGGTLDEYFERVLNIGFDERRAEEWDPQIAAGTLTHSIEEYRERLNIEIATIKNMGFPGYFLIVWDFIKYAQDQGIPVGPGRGSAAGSLAAYCMRITDVDPLQYELLFERFLNPERVTMPDIDIDFCIRGRGQVIEHVSNLYGRDSVCQIITFGTMASRAAIKDVGRALNLPYGDVEKIAKMIPPPVRGRNVSISKALETVPELIAAVKAEPRIKELVDLALRVEGCARHTSVHAAGVVISPKPLDEIVPIAVSAKEELTSQYPMNDLEKVGMLKMDFLGLTTLTVIADCLASMKDKLGVEIDWAKIPTNDPKTMQLFADGRTEAIFQFESSGMQDMCRRLKPGELEDLSALNALYRPGPLDGGMIDDFIDRHRGIKPVEYLLPEMEEILGNTFGVLVYQEQIMQLLQKLAGYSLGGADLVRRAMGKKKVEEMAEHETTFIDGAVKNGIARKTAKDIFELMAKFADYGFNRSHSMAYAVLAFRTAYLKAHYPAYFYASVLSHEAQDATKVYKYTSELRTLGLELLPPDINESDDGFTPVGDTVRYGLTAIKGLGQSSVAAIVDARANGRFTSLFDFCSRIRTGAVNKRGLESLIVSGAFDSIRPESLPANLWRPRLFAAIDSALQYGQRAADDRQRGQSGLFGEADGNDAAEIDDLLPVVDAWTTAETAKREKDALGLYISAHPLDNFAPILAAAKIKNFGDLGELNSGDIVRVAGMISGLQIRTSKRGNRFATFRLEDRSGGLKGVAVGENLAKYITYLKDDELVIGEGKIEAGDGQDATLMINDVKGLEDALAAQARSVKITLPSDIRTPEDIEKLFAIVDRHSNGRCGIIIDMIAGGVAVRLESRSMLIEPGRSVQRELESRGCIVEWQH